MTASNVRKLVLAGATIALLAVLAVCFLKAGEDRDVPVQAAEEPDKHGTSDRVEAGLRVPLPAAPIEKGADLRADAVVEGEVGDAAGTPLSGVSIAALLLEEPRADWAQTETTSDARGRFAIALRRDAGAVLAFSCPGYRPSQWRGRAPTSNLHIVLERSPTFRGRVVHRDGAPVAGASVRWSSPRLANGAGVTTTAADGRFVFDDVPWALDLEVLATNALPEHRSVQVSWDMDELVILVDAGREATGTVLEAESGAGVAGASVELWYYAGNYTAEGRRGGAALRAERVTARADGSFTLTMLPSASSRRRPHAWLWVTALGHAPHWKAVPSAERAGGLEAVLYRAGSVRGRVVDASGAPVCGQRVFAEAQAQLLCDPGSNEDFRRQDGGYGVLWNTRRPEAVAPFHTEREACTDSMGGYVIDGIPCPASGGDVTVALPAGSPSVTVLSRPGVTVTAEDIVRPEGLFRDWRGVVQDERARPVPGVAVELSTARTMSDDRGRFALEVPASTQGELTLLASAPGHVPFRRVFAPTRGLYAECDDAGVTITLARGARLAVLVLDRNQRPAPDASVQVFTEGALAEFAQGGHRPFFLVGGRTDDRGAVLLEGVPETCDILIEHPRSNASAHSKLLERVRAVVGPLRVVLDDLDVFAGKATIVMRVIDGRTGAAFGGWALIEARSEKHGARQWRAPGPEIRLEGLPLGEWEVRVAADGVGTESSRVQLLADRQLEIRLGEGPAIVGLVTCAAGPLAQPVQVQALDVASKRRSVTRADVDGHFSFVGMKPGVYSLSVEPHAGNAFARHASPGPQRYASQTPLEVRVGAASAPVILPVVPVAALRVIVAPVEATREARSLWSWAQDLRFTVTDEQGRSVYAGGASDLMASAARLVLPLAEGRYTVTARLSAEVLGERVVAAGQTWRIDAQ